MSKRELPANHELAQQVQRTIVKVVLGMLVVMVLPMAFIIHKIVDNGKPMQIGKEAPQFMLPDQDNHNVSIRDYLGHWCLVYFYNDARRDSEIQADSLRTHYDEFSSLDVALVGISYDSVPSHHAFAQKMHITHALLSDPEGEVIDEYKGNSSMNHMARNLGYLIDDHGVIKKIYLDLPAEELFRRVDADVRKLKLL